MQSRVGTWTLLFSTSTVMKASSDGSVGSAGATGAAPGNAPLVGVAGGDGSGLVGAGPHWMTAMALAAR